MSQFLKIIREVKKFSDNDTAKILQRYFKTGKGEYGEGDIFLGLTTPEIQGIAKKYYLDCSYDDLKKFFKNAIHEYRMLAIRILTLKYEKGTPQEKNVIFHFYIRQKRAINNWDLVDTSAPYIVGDFLLNRNRKILYTLARSKNLWVRRISIVSTYAFIRNNEWKDTFALSKMLINDTHDLIHKACGWMLREVGKRDRQALESFLQKHKEVMPRTTLRYAIERFDEPSRKKYLLRK